MDTVIQVGSKISLPHGARATLRAESLRARGRYAQNLAAGERLWWGEGKWVRIAKQLHGCSGRAGPCRAGPEGLNQEEGLAQPPRPDWADWMMLVSLLQRP